jgi:hypothetical protein
MEQKVHEIVAARPVHRLLRCQKTNRYYTGDGWSDEARQAQTYQNELDAVRVYIERKMRDVELVLRFPGSDADLFATPIG